MLVWGGLWSGSGEIAAYMPGGARYNPQSDSWSLIATNNRPSPRGGQTAVWTGSEMLVWGGYSGSAGDIPLQDGAIYHLASDSWTPLPALNAPAPRFGHTAVWSGTDMIIWGGGILTNVFADGARFQPSTMQWFPIPAESAPDARMEHSAAWTGANMLIVGGRDSYYNFSNSFRSGFSYDPADGSWRALTQTNAPSAVSKQTAVWAGNAMVVSGGVYSGGSLATGIASIGENLYAFDAIPDAWQRTHFGRDNPNGLPGSDPDGDGLSNEFEYFAGLDPTNAASLWHLNILPVPGGGDACVLQFSPRYANRLYTVEASTNSLQPPWMEVMGTTTNNTGFLRNVSIPSTASNATYRVRISLP
jgi:N-acetylneuraminic acid mutarotase